MPAELVHPVTLDSYTLKKIRSSGEVLEPGVTALQAKLLGGPVVAVPPSVRVGADPVVVSVTVTTALATVEVTPTAE